ncbi:WG repeat-containing protein [Paenibacillus sp. A3]|uniref:WG repeat-containing protein n=1 Tax=Paenibacillus sp. A3 TaxID=1337054 RepID=UPI0006D55BAA|nr:WG repeat-containing protein [Paenibacillus sp. A3]
MVVEAKFDSAHNFSEGRALVGTHKKYGFIDESGADVISPQFRNAYNFPEGLAVVQYDKKLDNNQKLKWTLVNIEGKQVSPLQFDRISTFSEG